MALGSFVQGASSSGHGDGSASVAVPYGSNVTKNNLLLLLSLAGTGAFLTVNDTLVNTWNKLTLTASSIVGGSQIFLWWALANSTGANTVTCAGAGQAIFTLIGEYSANSQITIDLTGVGSLNQSGTSDSVSDSTTAAQGLLISGGFCSGSTILNAGQIAAPFTPDTTYNGFPSTFYFASNHSLAGAGSYTAQFTVQASDQNCINMASWALPSPSTSGGWLQGHRAFVNKRGADFSDWRGDH